MERRAADMRRSSLPSQPYTKVVGFKVEGMAQSPSGAEAALGEQETYVGSPSPVIIPTSSGNVQAQESRRASLDGVGGGSRTTTPPLPGQGPNRHTVQGVTSRDRTSADTSDAEARALTSEVSSLRHHSAMPALGAGMVRGPGPSQAPTASAKASRQTSPMPSLQAPSLAASISPSPSTPASPGPRQATQDPFCGAPGAPPMTLTPGTQISGASSSRAGSGVAATATPAAAAVQTVSAAGTAAAAAAQPGSTKPPTKPQHAQTREKQQSQTKSTKHQQAVAKQGKQGSVRQGSQLTPATTRSTSGASLAGSSRPLQVSGSSGSKGSPALPGPSTAARQQSNVQAASTGLELFAHLPPPRKMTVATALHRCKGDVHPAVIRLGLDYTEGKIRGADARCIAMLETFRCVVKDYRVPQGKLLQRDLVANLSSNVSFLVECRPLGTAMGNAIKFLKMKITELDGGLSEHRAREEVLALIDYYIKHIVLGSCKLLVEKALDKIVDGDVVLTYAMSSVVLQLLCTAKKAGRKFRVIVVDGRPMLEGREMMRRLLGAGISATYALTSGLSYLIKEVTKVCLGAAAVLSNGTVISRVGCALVAMTAHSAHVPVLVCAGSHKFHERVQLDSITYNELASPDDLAHVDTHPELQALGGWQQEPCLGMLNVVYDAMPSDYIDLVCTEYGPLPASSVPVILRESREEWSPTMH